MRLKSLVFLFILVVIFLSSCDVDQEAFIDPTVEQFNREVQEIDNYLSSQNIIAKVDIQSGIRYVVEEQGTGLEPIVVDSLTLTYTNVILSSGAIVEEKIEEKIRSSLLLRGIAISSTFIQEGGKVTAYIPSVYMYGSQGNNDIPANSTIVAELEVNELHNEQLRKDISLIVDSLSNADTLALAHPTGIRYFLNQGSGDSPTVINSVNINYVGRFFNGQNAGLIFDQAENVTFNLQNLIVGWQIMIPEMQVGGKITMILPSSFAYGSAGSPLSSPPIGPDEILVFDVTLLGFN